jgi:hypothetical protein
MHITEPPDMVGVFSREDIANYFESGDSKSGSTRYFGVNQEQNPGTRD